MPDLLGREFEQRRERCGRSGHDVEGEVVLRSECLSLVLREWRIRFNEFRQLTEAQR